MVRRVIAIVLTLLAAASLFWPSVVGLGSKYQAMVDANQDYYDSGLVDRILERQAKYAVRQYDISDVETVEKDLNKLFNMGRDGALTVFEMEKVMLIANRYVAAIKDSLKELRDRIDTYGAPDSVIRQVKSTEKYLTYAKIGVIVYNVLFFGMLAFCLMSVILMVFGKPALNVIHTVFAFLLTGVFTAAIIVLNHYSHSQDFCRAVELTFYAKQTGYANLLAPGISLFVTLPLSLAATIIYKRSRGPKAAKIAAQPAPVCAAPVTQQPAAQPITRQPVQQPAAPQPEAQPSDEWICPACTAKNPKSAPFCEYCGTANPTPPPAPEPEPEPECEPAPEPAPEKPQVFCMFCGRKIDADLPFCKYCGQKQDR